MKYDESFFYCAMSSLHDQICFSGKSDCTSWKPNSFKKDKCSSCCFLFTDHISENVTEYHITCYLDCINSKNPANEILPASKCMGALYLGSYQALLEKNIKKYNFTKAVQTAIDLEKFFAGWGTRLAKLEKDNVIELLRLHWKDGKQPFHTHIDTPFDTVIHAVEWIHHNRINGDNVLVNCAQGKSRSTTIVICYLMALQKLSPNDALAFVKSKRSLAEPNDWFMENLELFHQSPELAILQTKLNTQ